MTLAAFVACAGAGFVGLACSDGGGQIRGGQTQFDGAPPSNEEGDPGLQEGDASDIDAASWPEEQVDAGSGTTWTDLYRDFFGPTGAASCSSSGTCHGDPAAAGTTKSAGYLCADKDGCRQSMLSDTTALIQTRDFSAPEGSTLVRILWQRKTNGTLTGSMPKTPRYVFSRASLERIQTWIGNGAPND
ncbi:hypothetical protein AKJ09_02052 [Labilithrix luteola]|uniref:Uncharacterized protein n=1 Tax=Labilithrix luteola TaxID=1391654 RepID=A0A0K1PPD7_9BACT|nr:hypothetical protein AKJ09_02052 [Labilithrix luteola]